MNQLSIEQNRTSSILDATRELGLRLTRISAMCRDCDSPPPNDFFGALSDRSQELAEFLEHLPLTWLIDRRHHPPRLNGHRFLTKLVAEWSLSGRAVDTNAIENVWSQFRQNDLGQVKDSVPELADTLSETNCSGLYAEDLESIERQIAANFMGFNSAKLLYEVAMLLSEILEVERASVKIQDLSCPLSNPVCVSVSLCPLASDGAPWGYELTTAIDSKTVCAVIDAGVNGTKEVSIEEEDLPEQLIEAIAELLERWVTSQGGELVTESDSTRFQNLVPTGYKSRGDVVSWYGLQPCDSINVISRRSLKRQLSSHYVESSLDVLIQEGTSITRREIVGGIFHAGRCGVGSLLELISKAASVSAIQQMPMLQSLLDLERSEENNILKSLSSLVQVLADRCCPENKQIVVGLKSWQILDAYQKHLVRGLPLTKKIFLYRHPVEIIAAILRTPNRPSSLSFVDHGTADLSQEEKAESDMPELVARSLGNYFAAALTSHDESWLLINADKDGDSVAQNVLRFLGLSLSLPDQITNPMTSDFEMKLPVKSIDNASRSVWVQAEKWAMPNYVKLEHLRKRIAQGSDGA